ncbi:MAG: amidase, partial [Alphaproteobacteria bacterium]|nr:amidase [Alphaproteobacteria bacterium]
PMGPATTEGWNGQSVTHAVSRTVRDNAALLDASHGREPGSRYDAPAPDGSFLSALDADPKPLRIALWSTAPNGTKPDAEAQAGLDHTRALLEALGHVVEEAGPVMDGDALGKGVLMTISAAMAMIMEDREKALGRELGPDDMEVVTLRMREFGKTVPMAELMRANQAAINAAMAYEHFLDEGQYDFTLSPTLSREPDPLGRLSLSPVDLDDYGQAVTTFAPWCAVFNQMGAPAMSVPLHWSTNNLPIGMMFGGRCGTERDLFKLAGQLERAAPWADRKPPVWVG